MTKAFIFDLDGTLINLPIDYDRLFKELGKIMKTAEIRPITTTIAKLDEKTKKKAFTIWESIELDAFEKMSVNNEGMNLYERFSDKPKALVTMQGKTLVQNAIENLGLSFDSVITREESLSRKEQLELAAKKLAKPFRDILFVGNTDEDAHAAEEAGCNFLKVGE